MTISQDRLHILKELRDRVAKAQGPDREIDCLLAFAFTGDVQVAIKGPLRAPLPYMLSEAVERPSELRQIAADDSIGMILRYTASIDAAVTLVPQGWEWNMSKSALGRFYCFVRNGNHRTATELHEGHAETPALALCLARIEYEIARAEATEKAEG